MCSNEDTLMCSYVYEMTDTDSLMGDKKIVGTFPEQTTSVCAY